jgi:hypothetical protein
VAFLSGTQDGRGATIRSELPHVAEPFRPAPLFLLTAPCWLLRGDVTPARCLCSSLNIAMNEDEGGVNNNANKTRPARRTRIILL